MKKRLIFLISALVICSYVIGQTYTEVEKYYNKIAATHKVEKKLDGYNFYSITNKEAVEILGGCYHWGSSGNGSLALVVGENETYAVLDFAQDLFPNPPYSNVTGSVTEKAVFLHDGVWSVGKAGDQIIFRCFKCSVKIYLIDYKNTKWVGNHWTSPDKPTQFWFAVSTANTYAFRMGQLEWETMTKENVRLGGNQTAEHVLTQFEAERRAELEAKAEADRKEAERKAKLEAERKAKAEADRKAKLEAEKRARETLNVRVTGDIPPHTYENSKKYKYIVINDGAKKIGCAAFKGCENVMSIDLPSSINTIGDSAFMNCTNLTSITVPVLVGKIGGHVFEGCTSLTSITLPRWLKEIGYDAFSGCTSLTSITLPNGLKEIDVSAFSGCTSLTSITLPNSLKEIGYDAFSGCTSLTSITLPNGLTEIGRSVFSECKSLTSVIIPNSVTSIGRWAFSHCASLSSITIPSSVTEIEDTAFWGCSNLTSITIPNSVTKIGKDAFHGCSNLNLTLPKKLKGKVKTKDCKSVTFYK